MASGLDSQFSRAWSLLRQLFIQELLFSSLEGVVHKCVYNARRIEFSAPPPKNDLYSIRQSMLKILREYVTLHHCQSDQIFSLNSDADVG